MSVTPNAEAPSTDAQVDQAVAQGGAYDVLRRRLDEQGSRLRSVVETLNARRLQEFGDSRMETIGRLRIRTEHNSVGRDIVQVGDLLLMLGKSQLSKLIAWFGDSIAIAQHLQISRLRALELARPMLRATNTGATAAIDHRGHVTHQLPRLTRGALDAEVAGRDGLTPFARWASRWGLWPVLWIVVALPLLLWRRRKLPPKYGR